MRRRISGWTVGVSLVILAAIAALVLWPKKEVAREPVNFGGLIVPGESTWGDSVEDTTILHWEWAHCENDGSTVEMREVRPGCSINNSIFIADSIRRARFRAEQGKAIDFDWAGVQKAYEQAEDRRIERIVRKVLKEAKPVKQIVDTCERSASIMAPIQGLNYVWSPLDTLRSCRPVPIESLPIWEDLRKRRIEGRYPETTGGVWVGVPKP